MKRCRPVAFGRGAIAAVLASLGLIACVNDVPPPTAQMGASSQAILNAERAGAMEYAPAELQMAKNKMAAADRAMRADNRIEARRLAEAAQADADYAAAKAQNAAAQQAATTVRRDLQSLRSGSPEPFGATGAGLPPSTAPSTATVPPPVASPPTPLYRGPTTWVPDGIQQRGYSTTTTTTTQSGPVWAPGTSTSVEGGKSVSVGVPRQ
ncbi:MAG TPA: DUF4398 domain-containing protein [Azospirillum sp.]|nr:DUF4398 domain-containing protein [Azospirillum sp.]